VAHSTKDPKGNAFFLGVIQAEYYFEPSLKITHKWKRTLGVGPLGLGSDAMSVG
jgi:hypothetical protein